MRVSSYTLFTQNLTRMLELQADIARFNEQVSTGRRVLSPADDPTVAARAVEIDESIASLNQYQRNAGMAEARVRQQEAVLDSAQNLLVRVNDLMIQGKSGGKSDADRRFIAAEIRERREELIALANTRNSSGEFIFSGYSVDVQPFAKGAGGVVQYAGDQGVRELQISETRTIPEGFTGAEVFMAVRNGTGVFQNDSDAGNAGTGRIIPGSVIDPAAVQPHDFRIVFTGPATFDVINDTTGATVLAAQTYVEGAPIAFNGIEVTIEGVPQTGDFFTVSPSSNQSMFETLKNVIDALETPLHDDAARAQFTQAMDNAINDTSLAVENLLETRATIGGRLNALDGQTTANEDFILQLETAKSDFEDVDLVEAISRLTRATTTLQAAQATFARVQGLSLFNFL